MSERDFRLDLRGLPEVQRMLGQVQGAKLNNRVRRALTAGSKPIRQEMRRQGARPGFPRTFRKIPKVARHRNPLGISVSPWSPLWNIFEHGAKAHDIGRPGQLLYNPAAPFVARGPVHHPGMAARPLVVPVFDASESQAGDAFEAKLLEGL